MTMMENGKSMNEHLAELERKEPDNLFSEDFFENPFAFEKDEPAGAYPMNVEELKAIARHWWEQYFDTSFCCWLFNTWGGFDGARLEYAGRRLERIERILGETLSARVYDEAQKRFGERVGSDAWQAYKEGRLVFDQDSTEEERAECERITGKASWVCQSRRMEP